jgi:hypothetical protein
MTQRNPLPEFCVAFETPENGQMSETKHYTVLCENAGLGLRKFTKVLNIQWKTIKT